MLHVPSMEGLGRCLVVHMRLPSFCFADDEHNAAGFGEETRRRLSYADASDSPTDCPAQHGGAKRQPLTDVAALPKRGIAARHLERPSLTQQRFANASACMSVTTGHERRARLFANADCHAETLEAERCLDVWRGDNATAFAAP